MTKGKVFLYNGFNEEVPLSQNGGSVKAQNSVYVSPGSFSVPAHALWFNKCTGDLPKINEQTVYWRRVEVSVCIFR